MVAAVEDKAAGIFQRLDYQIRFILDRSRFIWLNWSRQTGKSLSAARKINHHAWREPNSLWVLLSAGERQCRELMAKVQAVAKVYGYSLEAVEGRHVVDEKDYLKLELHLPNGARVVALPANPDTARGWSGNLFLDEFAIHKNADEIWAAAFPSITHSNDYRLMVASTPKGKSNKFASLATNKRFAHYTTTIHDAIADGLNVDPEELREALGDDDLWQQEYLCEFIDEIDSLLPWELIRACENDGATIELPEGFEPQGPLFLGWDLARRVDLAVIWLWEQLGDVLWTRAVVVMKKTRFAVQEERFAALMNLPRAIRGAIDATGMGERSAEWAEETWGEHRVDKVNLSSPVRTTLAGQFRKQFEDRRVRVPPDEVLRQDLHSVKRIITGAGNFRVDFPRKGGSHADRFVAGMLGVEAANEPAAVAGVYVL